MNTSMTLTTAAVRRAPRRRPALVLGGLLALALVLVAVAGTSAPPSAPAVRAEALGAAHGQAPQVDADRHARSAREREIRSRFDQAVVMLHARQYELAIVALERVLQLAPRLPEAEVNLGFARLGAGQAQQARAAFERALEIRPDQSNAYYGLALASEALGDRAIARGAMRSYLHLSRGDAPHRSKARAALWEWEQADAAAAPGANAQAAAPPTSVVRLAPAR